MHVVSPASQGPWQGYRRGVLTNPLHDRSPSIDPSTSHEQRRSQEKNTGGAEHDEQLKVGKACTKYIGDDNDGSKIYTVFYTVKH